MRGIPAKLITCYMNYLKKFILAAVSVLTFTAMSAQQRPVRGKVYDETSQPWPERPSLFRILFEV